MHASCDPPVLRIESEKNNLGGSVELTSHMIRIDRMWWNHKNVPLQEIKVRALWMSGAYTAQSLNIQYSVRNFIAP